jgi:hypothetical protein
MHYLCVSDSDAHVRVVHETSKGPHVRLEIQMTSNSIDWRPKSLPQAAASGPAYVRLSAGHCHDTAPQAAHARQAEPYHENACRKDHAHKTVRRRVHKTVHALQVRSMLRRTGSGDSPKAQRDKNVSLVDAKHIALSSQQAASGGVSVRARMVMRLLPRTHDS